jgi:hypothetical protein
MKAKAKFVVNMDAILAADKAGMEVEEEFVWTDFYFDARVIHAAHLSKEGNIILHLPSGEWTIKFDQQVWNMIVSYLTQAGL